MPIVSMPDGLFVVFLDPVERKVLRQVCTELRTELAADTDDPTFQRLFPTAYADDPERQQFFDQMTRGDLTDQRLAALDLVVATADRESLTAGEAESWMAAINALRLVLGTRLDISEEHDLDLIDPDDPNVTAYVVYEFLTALLGSIIVSLRTA